MKKIISVFFMAALLIISVSCRKPEPAEKVKDPALKTDYKYAPLTENDMASLVKGNNEFAFNLYGRLKDNPGNLFFAPYSISTAFAMTYGGASGNTEKQMAGVMRYTLLKEKLHPAFYSLQTALNGIQDKGDIKLSVANALWPEKTYPFLSEYIALNKKYYGVEISPVDYKNDADGAKDIINEWVEEKTEGKIKDLIPPNVLNELTRLTLTNAIYFKGLWESQFKKENTRPMDFHITKTKTKETDMMFQKNEFNHSSYGSFQMLELPYKGNDLSMIILLPNKIEGLEDIEKELAAEKLNEWISGLTKKEVNVYLPKFKIESEFNLSAVLKNMGMEDAFSLAADFSGIDGTDDLFIQAALHKAFVAVDEEGTEAAAATAVVIGLKSIPMYYEFKADRPFLFFIRENESGSILFLGRLAEPE